VYMVLKYCVGGFISREVKNSDKTVVKWPVSLCLIFAHEIHKYNESMKTVLVIFFSLLEIAI
jgi:hypothetical protein